MKLTIIVDPHISGWVEYEIYDLSVSRSVLRTSDWSKVRDFFSHRSLPIPTPEIIYAN